MMNIRKVATVLFCLALATMTTAVFAQTPTVPVDISSTVTTTQGQILAYLPTILGAAAAVTVAFVGARVFMKWIAQRAKSS